MVDWHRTITDALHPVRVKPADSFLLQCTHIANHPRLEIHDTPPIIVSSGSGTGVIDNPYRLRLQFLHLGNAIKQGARKQNQLPSACDIAIECPQTSELILAELTCSKQRSVEGVSGAPTPGKRIKAQEQLKKTIGYIEQTGYVREPGKKTAIFFFRLTDCTAEPAARMLRAMSLSPTLSQVTTAHVDGFPSWEFRSHPYPYPYTVR